MTEQDYKKLLKGNLIEYRTSLNLPDDVTFGIEIEYENIVKDTVSYLLKEEESYNLIGWKNKSEFDISEYNTLNEEMNGEINSPILRDTQYTWESLEAILNLLDNNGAIITEKCGGHVNIGAHILENNNKYWRNFLLLWILYEKEIYKFSSGEFLKLRNNINIFIKRICPYLLIESILECNNKYYLLSISNVLHDRCHDIYFKEFPNQTFIEGNRIEFRIPNGTLSKEIWQNYINFFVKFLLSTKKEIDIEKILYKINNNEHNAVELADLVFDNDIDKEYFLIQALKTNKVYKKEIPKHIKYY